MANLSQKKRERMLAFLETLKAQHTDDDSLIALGEIEKELKSKKYGLVWEEHEETVDVMMQTHIPVFTEMPEKEITADTNNENYNFLLEGDNLHSLHLLEKTHRGQIDVIYIDPPYNTGSKDFIYNDKFVDTVDSFRHSKWLSFMHRRLLIAKKLLSKFGVLFIHIDDNEIAQLKLLCDDVFGADNCLGIIIQNKLNAKNDTIDIQKNHEYILAYRSQVNYVDSKKTKILPTIIRKERKLRPAYIDEKGRYYYINDAITTRGEGGILNARPNLGYTVYYNPNTNSMIGVSDYDIELAKTSNNESEVYSHKQELIDKGYIAIIPPKVRGKLGCWTWSIDKFNAEKDNIIITGASSKFAVKKRTFVFEKDVEEIDGKLFYISDEETNSRSVIDYSTNDGTNSLSEVLGESGKFNNAKNLDMIEYLVSLKANKTAIILDFFAGSGTTGHAVLKLNQKDNGNRKFILCTNNENGICENVTYQRLKTVITGMRADGSEYSEGIPANLKYFRTDFVDKESEQLSDELLAHISEMIQLEHGVKIDDQKYVIIMDDEEMDAFEKNFDNYPQLKAVFINQDVFLSSSQEAMLENIDTYTIPDYYFDFELREAGEIW